MRYTILLDDTREPRSHSFEADSYKQARAELLAHLHDNPITGNATVTADVGEPGDETPRWFMVATARGIRTHRRPLPVKIEAGR